MLKRRRELKKDGKKKKREETVARSRGHLSEIDTRAYTNNDVLLTQKKGRLLRLQIARTKRREAELDIRITLTNSLNDFVENMYTIPDINLPRIILKLNVISFQLEIFIETGIISVKISSVFVVSSTKLYAQYAKRDYWKTFII